MFVLYFFILIAKIINFSCSCLRKSPPNKIVESWPEFSDKFWDTASKRPESKKDFQSGFTKYVQDEYLRYFKLKLSEDAKAFMRHMHMV